MKDTYRTSFFIDDVPLLPNVTRGMHWAAKARDTKKWHQLVGAALAGKKPVRPLKCATLTLVRYSSVRPDDDNLTASFKPVIDALTVCGVIEDDNPEVLKKVVYLWEFAKPKTAKTFVRVEELRERAEELPCLTNEGETNAIDHSK